MLDNETFPLSLLHFCNLSFQKFCLINHHHHHNHLLPTSKWAVASSLNLVPRSLKDEAESEIWQSKKICFS